jgi:class 3 adenylate cyclase
MLGNICPKCANQYPTGSKFCPECGFQLQKPMSSEPLLGTETEKRRQESLPHLAQTDQSPIEGERKYITVLFSDLSGYTALSEKLDPEDVKEILGDIFKEISRVVARYDGFIEKYVGDAVMALFGVKITHEDDPIRAILAAREIHERVDVLSKVYERCIPVSIPAWW